MTYLQDPESRLVNQGKGHDHIKVNDKYGEDRQKEGVEGV